MAMQATLEQCNWYIGQGQQQRGTVCDLEGGPRATTIFTSVKSSRTGLMTDIQFQLEAHAQTSKRIASTTRQVLRRGGIRASAPVHISPRGSADSLKPKAGKAKTCRHPCVWPSHGTQQPAWNHQPGRIEP